MVQITRLFTLCFALVLVISIAVPAYAEVNSLKTDKTLYKKNVDTTMTFTGTASEEDINKSVNIVINDPGGNFVTVYSGSVGADKTFEVKIPEKYFSKVTSHGTYNATAFVKQKTAGVTITFDYSVDGTPIHPTTQPSTTTQPTSTPTTSPKTTTQQSTDNSDGKSIQDKIQERIEAAKKQSQTTDSTEKSIEDKIKERIEAAKKQESKTNTTGSTGEVKPTGNNTKPGEKPVNTGSNPVSLDANILFIALGLGAAAAVAIGVYSMKLKPKFLAREVSDNVSTGQQHSDSSSLHEEDYAFMILKNRLAKGEITVEEFNELKRALKD